MASLSGHRESYQTLFVRLFGLEPSVGKVSRYNFSDLLAAGSLLFGTIDDDYKGFFVVSLVRAFLGRRTVGLFLRPQTCFGLRALRYSFKKFAFKVLKHVPLVSVFTIIPFSVAPQYKKVATAGVTDPQLWDMEMDTVAPRDAELANRISRLADGRRVLVFVGTVSSIKGIEFLYDMVSAPAWPHEQILTLIAGKFSSETQHLSTKFSSFGALVLNRFISDDEIQTIYTSADFVWACYRKDYDQSSGIFGRAVQFGKTPVVRSGSLIAGIAHTFSIDVIELEVSFSDPIDRLKRATMKRSEGQPVCMKIPVAGWKHDFEVTVGSAL